MWGFACDSAVPPAVCPNPGVVTVPGPALSVLPGDTTLTINLTNNLPVPVSIVTPGLAAVMTPVWTDGTSGPRANLGQRVRSFTHETGASGGTSQYVWNGVGPGTYLYQSGTQAQVQVQMGLYGAVTKSAAAGLAYDGVAYDLEHVLLFSEIDPALHDAVAGPTPTYGTPAYPSTIGYRPRYFLVNGAPFTAGDACLDGLTAGNRILLRMLNAGLRELAPTILQSHWDVVAEGGRPYRITSGATSTALAKEQYSVLLPPGGTEDVVFTPEAGGEYRIIDRRLNLTNSSVPDGGFQTCITVAAVAGQPIANANGPYTGTAGAPIDFSSAGPIRTAERSFPIAGTSATAEPPPTPIHTYAAVGTHTVRLTVTDSEGLTSTPDHTTPPSARRTACRSRTPTGRTRARSGSPSRSAAPARPIPMATRSPTAGASATAASAQRSQPHLCLRGHLHGHPHRERRPRLVRPLQHHRQRDRQHGTGGEPRWPVQSSGAHGLVQRLRVERSGR